MTKLKSSTAIATFAFGCFWGKEYLFQNTAGVIATRVGYMGGTTPAPTYVEVCSKKTGHAEAVEITFDASQISFTDLLKIFFQNHNPGNLQRQGEQQNGNYRSAIFFHDPAQEQASQEMIASLRARGHQIFTQLAPRGTFYPAEERHQGYCERTGNIPSAKNHPITFD